MSLALVLSLALIPLAALWVLPLCSDVISLLARQSSDVPPDGVQGSRLLLFVVPAHDEEILIGRTVRSLRTMQEGSTTRVIVIADNCTDATADRARQSGAEVFERHDPMHRGKPAAIAWLFERISLSEYDAVVIIDADTVVDSGFAAGLKADALLRDRVLQAHFGTANPEESWLTRLASLFEDVRYRGQFPLKVRAGLNVVLTGNGMCLGTGVLARHGWVTDALTEDLELYAKFTLAGVRIGFAPGAKLRAHEARDLGQARIQRRRWQRGRFTVLGKYLIPAIGSRSVSSHQKLDLLAELAFPGPVVHAAIAVCGSLLLLADGALPRAVGSCFAISLLPTLGWTGAALSRREDRGQLLLDLLRLPGYAIWRLYTAAGALVGVRSSQWERSPREPSG